jgi:DHA1 family tetracycline resistance protein-like MFS transporter
MLSEKSSSTSNSFFYSLSKRCIFVLIFEKMRINKNAAIGFIFITLLIDVIGFGIIIPVMPKLIEELKHVDVSTASKYGSWLMFAYAFVQFIFAPFLGGLSDKYGRRPVLLFSLLGFGVDYIFLAVAPTYEWLFVGRVIAGITGASFTTASAYIADISTSENRAKNFGMLGAAFGLGFIIGPVLGGFLGKYGERIPFYAAAVLALLNFLYGYFVLPESLPKENRREFSWKRANPIGALVHMKKYPAITGLIFSLLLIHIAAHAVQSNWSFSVMYRFNWDERMVGISLGVVGIMVVIVQGLLIRKINPFLGNDKSVYVGLSLYGLGMILFGIATKTWMMFAFLIPYCFGGIAMPALQAIMAEHVPQNEQGELQGTIASIMSVSAIIGPVLMNNLFYFFTHDGAPIQLPGAPFLMGSILMFSSAIIAYRTLRYNKW